VKGAEKLYRLTDPGSDSATAETLQLAAVQRIVSEHESTDLSCRLLPAFSPKIDILDAATRRGAVQMRA
jgi:hypothetical protein